MQSNEIQVTVMVFNCHNGNGNAFRELPCMPIHDQLVSVIV
jgi:hypothetical protein